MVESGDLARMDGSVVKVYLTIKAYVNFNSGSAFPSIDTIAENSGMSNRQVIRAIDMLETMGYITKEKRGRSNIYTLREKIDIKDSSGIKTAIASWDYAPSTVSRAVTDLKNVLVTGDLAGAKIIHIENLHVNIANDNAVQVNNQATNQLVDMGALKNILSKEAFERISSKLEKENVKLDM
jgi:DNA-binding GntR family transcriptional regulator